MRIISFSVKPTDLAGMDTIKKLREYSNIKGISISFLIIKAIKEFLERNGY